MSGAAPKERLPALQEAGKPGAACADCGDASQKPSWAAWNWGVFVCIACSGAHRGLGTHVSKVLSVTLDDWTEEQVALMEAGAVALPARPAGEAADALALSASASMDQRTAVIRAKYTGNAVTLETPSGSSRSLGGGEGEGAEAAHKTESDLQAAAAKYTGVLMVRLKNGVDLPSKDVNGLSDPYVKLHLGSQTVRSATVKKTLNPEWNENLMLNAALSDTVKLVCKDWDRFSPPDPIGEVDIVLAHHDLAGGETRDLSLQITPKGAVINLSLTFTALDH